MGVESDAVRKTTAAQLRGTKYFPLGKRAVFGYFHSGNALATSLYDIKIFLVGIEADFIGEGQAVRHDPKALIIRHRDKAIGDIWTHCLHPILDPSRYGQPKPFFGIA